MIKFITLSVIILGFLWGKSMPITIGDPAPDFSLPDENGQMHSLSQYRGRKVVVYFYPKDNTPGCTKEACGIRDEYSSFQDNQIVVFGVSYDNASSHRKFKKKCKVSLLRSFVANNTGYVSCANGRGPVFGVHERPLSDVLAEDVIRKIPCAYIW